MEKKNIDRIGTYRLDEVTSKTPRNSELSYEISCGEYPVMGSLSTDSARIDRVAIVFSAIDQIEQTRVSIVEELRPINIPELVQRGTITLERNEDKSIKFSLSMFIHQEKEEEETEENDSFGHSLRVRRGPLEPGELPETQKQLRRSRGMGR